VKQPNPTGSFDEDFKDFAAPLNIGYSQDGTIYWNGWIDDFRIVKGKALWTANFTAPTVSPSPKDVTANGNAQIDTAQKVFGTGSALFDGTGDYLTSTSSTDWDVWLADGTVDFWVKIHDLDSIYAFCTLHINAGEVYGFWEIKWDKSKLIFRQYDNSAYRITCSTAFTPLVDTWHHIAVVRSGNTCYMFIDGVKNDTDNGTFGTISALTGATLMIAYNADNPLYKELNGWIDELRISKGIARWTSNFTPPAKAYGLNTPRIMLVG